MISKLVLEACLLNLFLNCFRNSCAYEMAGNSGKKFCFAPSSTFKSQCMQPSTSDFSEVPMKKIRFITSDLFQVRCGRIREGGCFPGGPMGMEGHGHRVFFGWWNNFSNSEKENFSCRLAAAKNAHLRNSALCPPSWWPKILSSFLKCGLLYSSKASAWFDIS